MKARIWVHLCLLTSFKSPSYKLALQVRPACKYHAIHQISQQTEVFKFDTETSYRYRENYTPLLVQGKKYSRRNDIHLKLCCGCKFRKFGDTNFRVCERFVPSCQLQPFTHSVTRSGNAINDFHNVISRPAKHCKIPIIFHLVKVKVSHNRPRWP